MTGVALLSYGMSGKVFHAPFLKIHPGFKLVGAWERSSKNFVKDNPGTISFDSLEALLADDNVQLVVVNTPTATHYEYAKRTLEAGKDIVVEKAFTSTVEEAEDLERLAEKLGRKIAVFHNRRWDSDFCSVKEIVNSGVLGNIHEAEFRFERFRPALSPKKHKEIPGPGAGLLKDLGPHLIDQALLLFGMPEKIFADLRITRPGSTVNDWFDIMLLYADKRIRLKAGLMNRYILPGYMLHGEKGSFIKGRTDIQEAELVKGMIPGTPGWGTEPASAAGHLYLEGSPTPGSILAAPGNYGAFYDQLYLSLTNAAALPVSAVDGTNVVRIITAALDSAEQGRQIRL